MPNGGARPGAGRKKGAATIKTREIANRMAAEGITPLEVMLEAMRDQYAKATDDATPAEDRGAAWALAASYAKDAAPYLHPRLSTQVVKGDVSAPLNIQIVRFSDLPKD